MWKFKALLDAHAWLLMLPALLVLALIDWPMVKTMLEWSLFGVVLVGAAIIISRLVFPQIDIAELMRQVRMTNTAAGLVVAGLLIFFGLLVLALAGWSKP
jgi:uncharacterized membrane protein YjfL (UPF0719 family)